MHVYSSSAPYIGSGAPSSMYMGVPPYGSSLFNGSSMSPYDVPFSGGSAYPYNYGSRLSGGSPYRPLHIACPTPYSSGSMMGNGTCFSCASYWLHDLKKKKKKFYKACFRCISF